MVPLIAPALAAPDLGPYLAWYAEHYGKTRAPRLVEVERLSAPPDPWLPDGAGARLVHLGLRSVADGFPTSPKGAAWTGKKLELSRGVTGSDPRVLLGLTHALDERRWALKRRFEAPRSIDEGLAQAMLVEGTAWYELTRYVLGHAAADPALAASWRELGGGMAQEAQGRALLARYDALRSVIGLAGLAVRADWKQAELALPTDPSIGRWEALLADPPPRTAALFDPAAPPPVTLASCNDSVGELATAWAVERSESLPWLFGSWSNDAAAGLVGDCFLDVRRADGGPAAAWVSMWADEDERLQFAVAWRHAPTGGELRWIGRRAALFTWDLPESEVAALHARLSAAAFTQAGQAWIP